MRKQDRYYRSLLRDTTQQMFAEIQDVMIQLCQKQKAYKICYQITIMIFLLSALMLDKYI